MTFLETKYCQTVEKIMQGDEDAKDDLGFEAQQLILESPKKFNTCYTYMSMYQKIKEEK